MKLIEKPDFEKESRCEWFGVDDAAFLRQSVSLGEIHRPNENELSDRRRKRAVLRISLLKFSCGNFLPGRRFAAAIG
jgi:hypothetical protein